MEFSRQEYWCGLPFPSPGDLPNPGMEPGSPALQADSLPSKPQKLVKMEGIKKDQIRADKERLMKCREVWQFGECFIINLSRLDKNK